LVQVAVADHCCYHVYNGSFLPSFHPHNSQAGSEFSSPPLYSRSSFPVPNYAVAKTHGFVTPAGTFRQIQFSALFSFSIR
jgi:hypothetical protein